MDEIIVGSVVKLKSGTTIMTVEEIEGNDAVTVWEVEGEFRTRRFPLATLELADDTPIMPMIG